MDDAKLIIHIGYPASDWNAVRPVARTLIFSLLVTNNGHRKHSRIYSNQYRYSYY